MKSSGERATFLWCLFNMFPRLKQRHWHHQRQPEDYLRAPGVACCLPTLRMLWFSPESQQLCCTPAPAWRGLTGSIRFSKLARTVGTPSITSTSRVTSVTSRDERAPDKGARPWWEQRPVPRGARQSAHAERGRKMVREREKKCFKRMRWLD